MPRHSVTPEQMLRGGQVICGRNATRTQLNIAIKRAAGFDTVYPTGEARNGQIEKIICLKNRHDLGIVNGMFLELADMRDENEIGLSATIRTEDGDQVGPTASRRHGTSSTRATSTTTCSATPSASAVITGSRRA